MPQPPLVSTTPEAFPTTSPQLPSGDYSYTLEVVMAMQATLGKLTEAIDTLKGTIKNHGEKLDSVAKDVHTAKVLMRIFLWVIGATGLIGSIALKAFFDYYLRTHVAQK